MSKKLVKPVKPAPPSLLQIVSLIYRKQCGLERMIRRHLEGAAARDVVLVKYLSQEDERHATVSTLSKHLTSVREGEVAHRKLLVRMVDDRQQTQKVMREIGLHLEGYRGDPVARELAKIARSWADK